MDTIRYFIELSYNGKEFCGWQRQPNASSVQETIEDCLSSLFSNSAVTVTGCGRTDTGVHAKNYTLHVDLEGYQDAEKLKFKLNRMLPSSIAIFKIYPCSKHARFDAIERTYRYYIHKEKDAFINDTSWYFPQDLDFEAMNMAAKLVMGKQDFTSLSKLHTDVKTNICTVTKAEWIVEGNQAYFEIKADRFLRNMVRATVGTLLDVGLRKLSKEDVSKIIEAKDRSAASMSVPPQGLFLWEIKY